MQIAWRPLVTVLGLVLLAPAWASSSNAGPRKLLGSGDNGYGQAGDVAVAAAAMQKLWMSTGTAARWAGPLATKAGKFFASLSAKTMTGLGASEPQTGEVVDTYLEDGAGFYYDNDYVADYAQLPGAARAAPICSIAEDGTVLVAAGDSQLCDLRLEGFDAQADLLLGGLDGLYQLVGCHDDAPAFTRTGSPPGEQRWLFFSHEYGDWDVSRGDRPNQDILVYGSMFGPGIALPAPVSPQRVVDWQVGADLVSAAQALPEAQALFYVPAAKGARVTCAQPALKAKTIAAGEIAAPEATSGDTAAVLIM